MRPIDRQTAPKAYTRYEDALFDLEDRIGRYCCYCERYIETHLAVEHIQPKSRNKSLETEWTNLLLACVNCNSCKGKKSVVLESYFWPDVDNTLRCFTYTQGGQISVSTGLSEGDTNKAHETIKLTGLNREPGHLDPEQQPTSKDLRWRKRYEAWDKAQKDRAKLADPTKDSPHLRETIVEKAVERGMFSIWMTVFAGDADMRKRLVEAFRGTAMDCFDGDFNLVPRPRGSI